MLFSSYPLFVTILLFVLVFVGAKWVFRKGWVNNVLLIGGNILILTQIVAPKSLFWLSLLALWHTAWDACYSSGNAAGCSR